MALVASLRFAPTGGAAEPPSPITLEVELAPTVPDAEVLASWVHDESVDVLAAVDPAPRQRGTIRISIAGDLYDYQVIIATIREGSSREKSVAWACQCTNDELLARIRAEVATAVRCLDDPPGANGPAPASPSPRRWALQHLEPRGKLGLGLLVTGAAGAIVGTAFLAVGHRQPSGPNYLVAGIPSFVIGVGLLATGTTFLVLEHHGLRHRRTLARAAIVPFATRGSVHVGLTARF